VIVAPPVVGLTLDELAELTVERAGALVEPFVAAGIVAEVDGRLAVVEWDVRMAFLGDESEEAGA
jgi:hypothetical protein